MKFWPENKSACNGFEELLCYFVALLKRRGAVMNEQCGLHEEKNQLMAGRRAFRGNWVMRKWTGNFREVYWHRKFLPYIFFAALPFLSLLCCTFLCKNLEPCFTCGRESRLLDLKRSWEPCAPVSCVFEVFLELNFVPGINFSQKPSDAFYFLLAEDLCYRLLYVSLNYFPNG